ncbi:MAG TPA: hypothetical protein VN607_12270 [Gemmatimonadaceae bacterium]|nr:hypothetical protein [Gemmatimonadaceae bacterium]
MPHRPAPLDPSPASPRRGFLAQLATAAVAFAAGDLVRPPRAAAESMPNERVDPRAVTDTTPAPRGPWDLSWVDKLTAQHRQVFDSPAIADGEALNKAGLYLDGYHEIYGTSDKDVNVVIVIRHKGIPMALGDAVWARYDFLADRTKLKDPTTGKKAKRNPFVGVKPNDAYAMTNPTSSLDSLIARGVIVLCCNLALGSVAQLLADKTKQSVDTVEAELKRSLVPGVTLVPSGIFGVTRAEEAGCHYLGLA